MKRSELIKLLTKYNPEEDIEVVFIADGSGDFVVSGFGYHEILDSDIEEIEDEAGKIIGVSISTF